ncbi:hypothetical protein M405DRAFT_843313 [Rhizopogon salebrosus TDB-379]|nr:hypothetical protein M405DRAFT_843313 [Rhizopogon salebrosus TDB-379]
MQDIDNVSAYTLAIMHDLPRGKSHLREPEASFQNNRSRQRHEERKTKQDLSVLLSASSSRSRTHKCDIQPPRAFHCHPHSPIATPHISVQAPFLSATVVPRPAAAVLAPDVNTAFIPATFSGATKDYDPLMCNTTIWLQAQNGISWLNISTALRDDAIEVPAKSYSVGKLVESYVDTKAPT